MSVYVNDIATRYETSGFANYILPLDIKKGSIKIDLSCKNGITEKSVFGCLLIKSRSVRDLTFEIATNTPDIKISKEKFKKMTENESVSNFSLIDPLSFNVLALPSRGKNCNHVSCFELIQFLKYNY